MRLESVYIKHSDSKMGYQSRNQSVGQAAVAGYILGAVPCLGDNSERLNRWDSCRAQAGYTADESLAALVLAVADLIAVQAVVLAPAAPNPATSAH